MEEVFLDKPGMFLGKKSERLVIKKNRKVINEIPLFKVNKVMITSRGVSISSDAIEESAKRGIQIDFLNMRNEPYAKLSSPFLQGTVKTRRQQLLIYEEEKSIRIVKAFILGKVKNQVNLLKYMGKYRKNRNPELFTYIHGQIKDMKVFIQKIQEIQGNKIDEVRQEIMTLEAHCAKKYWESIKEILPDEVNFSGRQTRGAEDLVNSMLNYGYAILYSTCQGAILLAGLDPFAGFMHVDRSGRASLVLDFIEEFRQQVVDKTVFALINRNTKLEIEDNRLSNETKTKLREKLFQKLEAKVKYEGKKQRYRVVIQKQARRMATFIRGERDYKPVIGTW